jgi:integrase
MSATIRQYRSAENGQDLGQGAWRTVARILNRLSNLKVEKAKRPGLYSDGGGLYLRVAEGGSKQWVFRYATNGRLRDMGIGPVHTLSLAAAREKARQARELRLDGIDPIDSKRARMAALRAADAKAMTFKQCADAFIASHEAGWGNAKHRQQWANTLAQHVHPVIGGLPVHAIDTALVMKVLGPLWKTIPETASRVRGRIESVLAWATVSGFRVGPNPAQWRNHLDQLLPATSKIRKVEHLLALPYSEIGGFVARLRQESSIAARALEFLILTAGRLGEVLGMTWDEVDLGKQMWIIPAARMKAKRQHRVPLSDAAVALLKRMHNIRRGGLVFPGRLGGRPLGPITVLSMAKKIGNAETNVHGLRSTFRDWAAECTSFPSEVAEMALAHAIPDAVEAAYRRGDLFDKRRKLMDAWAAYCAKVETDAGKVVALARGRTPR